jgi:cytochrome c oxidase subunit 2
VLALVAAASCTGRYGAPEPASRQGAEVLDLWRVLFWAGAAVGGVVIALILWSVVRYRRRPGREPATFKEHVRLELAYTAVPVVVVVVLFGLTVAAQRQVTELTATPDVRVEVTGFQWGWRFNYLTEGVTLVGTADRPPTMILPLGQTTHLVLLSPDVIHSFYVPEFLVKRDLIPGVDNRIDVTPTRAGRFGGLCAEFCGLEHWRMTFTVEVVEPAAFRMRLAEEELEQPGQPDPEAPQGRTEDPGRQAAPVPPARAREVAVG